MNRKEFLKHICNLLPPSPICVEIGVFDGFFASEIYEILQPQKLFLIDPWEIGKDKNAPQDFYGGPLSNLSTAYSTDNELQKVKNKFSTQINDEQIILLRGYSYDFVDTFKDEYFDFIYIDATHIYESVKADLTMYVKKLKKNGFICGHDYVDHPSFSVIKAVDEFILENNLELFILSNDSDFALKYGENNA
jgi:hypothetical protein